MSAGCQLKREAERLETFRSWPVPFMDPGALARDGFYYTNSGDVVRCAFCGVSLWQWKEGDSAVADHRRESPRCPFLRERPVGNVPLGGRGDAPGPALESCGFSSLHGKRVVYDVHLGDLSLRTLGAICAPAFPEYSSYEARLSSFAGWPTTAKQEPASLSEAGFYHTGKDDETVCFHCGGPLKNWEEGDVPWSQHALWYPNCLFVLRAKGDVFVREACAKEASLSAAK
ncbi:baculoviral IAP repeat-containing protein 7-B-like isoform X2 [Bacillus rossius redtenbacheri]